MTTQTFYLHVGPAKTGTSAIQHFLMHHKDGAILYPRTGQWSDGSHHNLVLNFLDNFTRAEVIRQNAAEMLDEIGAEARQSGKDILISSEVLAGAKNIASFVDACRTRWGIAGLKIKILIVCREHFERASSLYNQRVKDAATLEREAPDEFLSQRADRLRYAPSIRRLEQTGCDVIALNYHPAETMLARFLAAIGDDAREVLPSERHNVSLSVSGLIVLLALNRISRSAEEREWFRAKLGDIPGMFSPSEFIFGQDAAMTAKKVFAKDKKILSEKFGIVFEPSRVKKARNSLFLDDHSWRDIADLASRLDGRGDAFLAEIAKFRQ